MTYKKFLELKEGFSGKTIAEFIEYSKNQKNQEKRMKVKKDLGYNAYEVERAIEKLRAILARNPEAREVLRDYLYSSGVANLGCDRSSSAGHAR